MRWTVMLVAEVEPGQRVEHDRGRFDHDERITPATLGLSVAEGKTVLAAIQARLVVDQVKRHGEVVVLRARSRVRTPTCSTASGDAPYFTPKGTTSPATNRNAWALLLSSCFGNT
jgi:hypothetical protein